MGLFKLKQTHYVTLCIITRDSSVFKITNPDVQIHFLPASYRNISSWLIMSRPNASMCRQLTKCSRNVRTPDMTFAWSTFSRRVSLCPKSNVCARSGVRRFLVRMRALYTRPVVPLFGAALLNDVFQTDTPRAKTSPHSVLRLRRSLVKAALLSETIPLRLMSDDFE